ncbi:class I SAM-dependent methyltransferase [Kribbella antibiotica]|uniref:Class I SAM-dependent methyltransferase n=1 Tax=Kribbella antibiotica TaxID=190195 RepID=A0A4R4YKA4_9ACTN|nr:class I SAM-dependent methyltransferase [Kribbella antibiotica]TDD45316.1 class I SAM-dependent methyltransferase [Kribbella antibiotica]
MDERVAKNRAGWDLRASAHAGGASLYDVDGFRAGGSSLRPFELEALGDVRGKRLLHLMCHFGLDTLSWARLGASVTGLDFSGEAVAAARRLADEVGLDARFVESDVYAAADVLDEQFDIVIATYGVLMWLPDLTEWARVVARLLRPGGVLFIAEFHPQQGQVDNDLRLTTSYFRTQPRETQVEASYTGQPVPTHTQITWPWTISGLLNALINAGLHITRLDELPVDLRQRHPAMVQGPDTLWRLPGDPMPLLLTCQATRPPTAEQDSRVAAA